MSTIQQAEIKKIKQRAILLGMRALSEVEKDDLTDGGVSSLHGHTGGGTAWGGISGTLSNQSDLNSALGGKADASHTHSYEPANANIQSHIGSSSNPHSVTKAQVGLGSADNTADTAKPVSTAQQTALDGKVSHSLATALNDFICASGAGVWVKKTLAETLTILGKAVASGLAPLDAASKVPTVNLGGAGASGSNYLRGDQTWATPAGGGITTLKTTADQTINAGAATFVDITGLTFPVVAGVDYAFHFYITFRSAQLTTGWKSGVNHPGGTLDFWAKSDVIANGAAGVATHTERHNVNVNDMTQLTATVTANVDLSIIIEGRSEEHTS